MFMERHLNHDDLLVKKALFINYNDHNGLCLYGVRQGFVFFLTWNIIAGIDFKLRAMNVREKFVKVQIW